MIKMAKKIMILYNVFVEFIKLKGFKGRSK